MIYYAYDKDGVRVPGFTGPAYKNGYPSIEWAMSRCWGGGHVEDEDGNIVWTWDDWIKSKMEDEK